MFRFLLQVFWTKIHYKPLTLYPTNRKESIPDRYTNLIVSIGPVLGVNLTSSLEVIQTLKKNRIKLNIP